jgi:hypothetical protein
MAGDLVRLTSASSGPEAEMIQGLLDQEGIRVLIQRPAGFDVPDFLAGGPRELFVRPEDHARASEIVESHFGLN